jgi:hypothetical protein
MELLLTGLEMLAGKVSELAVAAESDKRKALADTILKDLAGVRDMLTGDTPGKDPATRKKALKKAETSRRSEKKETMPAADAEKEPAHRPETAAKEKDAASGDALIVSSDTALNELVMEVLKSAGFHPIVLPAKDILAGKGMGRYSLVIIGLDGDKALKALYALKGTPRIVLKGWSDASRSIEDMVDPGVKVLPMPFSVEDFVTAVAELAVTAG